MLIKLRRRRQWVGGGGSPKHERADVKQPRHWPMHSVRAGRRLDEGFKAGAQQGENVGQVGTSEGI